MRLPYNLGYGAAVQTGMMYAVASGYEVCVLIDGDGQMDPHSIPALINQVENHRVDLALGSRFLGAANYTIPFGRRLGTRTGEVIQEGASSKKGERALVIGCGRSSRQVALGRV